jgi:hypothetical protein
VCVCVRVCVCVFFPRPPHLAPILLCSALLVFALSHSRVCCPPVHPHLLSHRLSSLPGFHLRSGADSETLGRFLGRLWATPRLQPLAGVISTGG